MFFLEEFNNMQLEQLQVYLLPDVRLKRHCLQQKTFCKVFFLPLKGGTIIIAAAQTENWSFCGQSKERDEGKPESNRLTVALVSLENKRCNLFEKP